MQNKEIMVVTHLSKEKSLPLCLDAHSANFHHIPYAAATLATELRSKSISQHLPLLIYGNSFAHEFHVMSIETRSEFAIKRINLVDHPFVAVNELAEYYKKCLTCIDLPAGSFEIKLSVMVRNSLKEKNQYYDFNPVLKLVTNMLENEQTDLNVNLPFIAALIEFITVTANDMLTTTSHRYILKILQDPNTFKQFWRKGLGYEVELSQEVGAWAADYIDKIKSVNTAWEPWKIKLLDNLLQQKYPTFYFPGTTGTLGKYFSGLGVDLPQNPGNERKEEPYSKLLSLLFNSNRPSQISLLFDSIDETTSNLDTIEVVVNIDSSDHAMERHLKFEQQRRDFVIKYIKTAPPRAFCDLWKPINYLLNEVDDKAYFVLVSSDEFLFKTQDWDKLLAHYVGLYPDHIFRLKASRNRHRTHFDRWECNFLQDCISFTTKRWFEISGNVCPCFGPDGFQQAIAFYMDKLNQFYWKHGSRDIPINELHFGGDTPSIGVRESESAARTASHTKALFIAQSHEMQLEAARRAAKLLCHIEASENNLSNFEVKDDVEKATLIIIDNNSGAVVERIYYGLPKWKMRIENFTRKFHFDYYFGLGRTSSRSIFREFGSYLMQRSREFRLLRNEVMERSSVCKQKLLAARDPKRLKRFLLGLPAKAFHFMTRKLKRASQAV